MKVGAGRSGNTEELRITCSRCKRSRLFRGNDFKHILKRIARAGWHDGPDFEDICPNCWKKWEEAVEEAEACST